MLQSRALVIALILLLSTTLPEVQSKTIFEKEHRDWMGVPDAIASYIYDAVSKVSPKFAQFLADVAQTPVVVWTRNFIIKETIKISILTERMIENIKDLWHTKILGY